MHNEHATGTKFSLVIFSVPIRWTEPSLGSKQLKLDLKTTLQKKVKCNYLPSFFFSSSSSLWLLVPVYVPIPD